MTRLLTLLALACICFAASKAQSQQCLKYEPETVTLIGFVFAKDFPGPPNYQSIRAGDERMRYWILRLDKPLCVDGGRDDGDVPVAKAREVQLVFADDSPYKKYGALVKSRARFRVAGTLFHQH